jgi:uncharacterized MAPEG superfamily protein
MTGMTALLLFAAWTLILMFIYVNYRVMLTFARKKAPNSWTRGQPTDDPPFIVRAHHAHLNCVENLPVFAAVVLAAYALGKGAIADSLAPYVLYLRLAQSGIHLISISAQAVFVRAIFFTLQALLMLYMIWQLVR